MNKENQTVLISPGQVKDLSAALSQSIPIDLTKQQAQYWLGHKGDLSNRIKGLLLDVGFDQAFTDWQAFYKDLFGLDVDLSGLITPPAQPGFSRLLVIAKDVTAQQAFDACQRLFSCRKYTNDSIDEVVPKNERTAEHGTYAIWVRNRQEADEELKNKSVDDLSVAKMLTETLLERIVHELKFFEETGDHLDQENTTLCAGSRARDGHVPCVRWLGGKLNVHWDHPVYALELLRARQVVSAP